MTQAMIFWAIVTIVVSMLIASIALVVRACSEAYHNQQVKRAFQVYTQYRLDMYQKEMNDVSQI